eukprot:2565359-Pyramimonas_sp.AAC.2
MGSWGALPGSRGSARCRTPGGRGGSGTPRRTRAYGEGGTARAGGTAPRARCPAPRSAAPSRRRARAARRVPW